MIPTALPRTPAHDYVAVIALAIVHAEDSTTAAAPIPLTLVFKESSESLFSKLPKVTGEADVEVFPVSLIQASKALTGKLPAHVAEPQSAFRNPITIPFQVGALFVPGPAARAMGYGPSLFRYAFRIGEVGAADCAIHAAGGNEIFLHFARSNSGSGVSRPCSAFDGGSAGGLF